MVSAAEGWPESVGWSSGASAAVRGNRGWVLPLRRGLENKEACMKRFLVVAAFTAAVVAVSAQSAFAEPNGGGSGGSSDACQGAKDAATAINNVANAEEWAAGQDLATMESHLANAMALRT